MKPDITVALEKFRDEELDERKEKRKKVAEEEAARKKQYEEELLAKGLKPLDWGRPPPPELRGTRQPPPQFMEVMRNFLPFLYPLLPCIPWN